MYSAMPRPAPPSKFALQLFPGKALTYELIYGARFERLMAEKFRIV